MVQNSRSFYLYVGIFVYELHALLEAPEDALQAAQYRLGDPVASPFEPLLNVPQYWTDRLSEEERRFRSRE